MNSRKWRYHEPIFLYTTKTWDKLHVFVKKYSENGYSSFRRNICFITYQTVRYHNPERHNINYNRRDNFTLTLSVSEIDSAQKTFHCLDETSYTIIWVKGHIRYIMNIYKLPNKSDSSVLKVSNTAMLKHVRFVYQSN